MTADDKQKHTLICKLDINTVAVAYCTLKIMGTGTVQYEIFPILVSVLEVISFFNHHTNPENRFSPDGQSFDWNKFIEIFRKAYE